MKNYLEYKGYRAKPELSTDDNLFYGVILGINDKVDFFGATVDEVVENFHQAVDDYLEFCQEIGKTPDKMYSGTFNVRISPELHKQCEYEAQNAGITLNAYVLKAIEEKVFKDTNISLARLSIGDLWMNAGESKVELPKSTVKKPFENLNWRG